MDPVVPVVPVLEPHMLSPGLRLDADSIQSRCLFAGQHNENKPKHSSALCLAQLRQQSAVLPAQTRYLRMFAPRFEIFQAGTAVRTITAHAIDSPRGTSQTIESPRLPAIRLA